MIRFILSSEETGWRHLYYVEAEITVLPDGEDCIEDFRQKCLQPQIRKKVQLTSGDWAVADHQVEVDPLRKVVFFHGYKDSVIEKHAYVVSLDHPCHIRRLTLTNYSHTCDFFIVSYF
jgi:hypothetical protein